MSETTLIKTENNELLLTDDDAAFASKAKTVGFLPTLKLFNSSAKAVKQNKIPMAHYGLVKNKDNIEDLGSNLDVIPVTHRFKAVEKVGDSYYSYYDDTSEAFKRTEATAAKDRQSGCMAGIEFLFWLPEASCFVLWYASTTSTLNIAKQVKAMYLKGVTLGVEYIETKKFSWHAPTIKACSTQLNVPSQDDLDAELNKFRNPKEAEFEVDTEGDARAT